MGGKPFDWKQQESGVTKRVCKQPTRQQPAMLLNSISISKLHCCLFILILFILIFLSLPLLLIYLANTRYEESQNLRTQNANLNRARNLIGGLQQPNLAESSAENQVAASNCTQFAIQANLPLIGEHELQCPKGLFACHSCPDICIEQWQNCNGIVDCPDRSDESSCHDSNGAMGHIFQDIVAAKKNRSSSAPSSSSLAKPDSCTFDQFVEEQCPCVYTDARVIICEGMGLTRIPNTFLSSVYKIRMGNNSIDNIDDVLWPKSLASLVLVNNQISHIGRSTFEMAPILSKLYLSHNEISFVDSEAFAGLSSLTSLQIESNKLETFDANMCKHAPVITKIYLSENTIDLPEETRFGQCKNLEHLLLDHNRISIIRSHWFSNMTSLIWLSLTHNQISVIEDGSFDWNYELEELNLAFNRIKMINRQIFAHKLNIQRLYLGGNPLQPLPTDAFQEIVHLKSLNLTNVDFDYIHNGTFSYLSQLEFIYFAKFRYCHYATHVRVCRPITDGLSSVEELLAFPILKYAVWIVASVCSLGNVFVFIWRSVSPHEDRTLSLFVRNLSIADLMMGIYLGAIGWQDWRFQHDFGRYAIEWMSSWKCTAIGFLAILSSELSVFILTIITIERYRSIISIRRFEEEAQKKRARVYVVLAWVFSFLIAFYPLVESLVRNSDYYATNGLCLPLHIDQPFTPGWQYSAFIYLGINFSAVIIIIALYIHMYTMIIDGRQVSRPALFKSEKREDAILAIRFFFIVVTDCLCWIPIVVIKIMALANVSISSSIYGWLVVFIIPINSALNPIVYTLAAPTSLRAAVCKLFERLCYKMDSIAIGGSNYSSHSSTTGNSESHMISSRQRRKTGSNSTTTCDTFDTSIASYSKSSVESALIHNESTCMFSTNLDLQSTNRVPKSPSSSASTANGALNRGEQQHRFNIKFSEVEGYHMMSIGSNEPTSKCYDCLSTYANNTIKHKIVVDQVIDQDFASALHSTIVNREARRSSRMKPYDSYDRRTSSESQGYMTMAEDTDNSIYNGVNNRAKIATNNLADEMINDDDAGTKNNRQIRLKMLDTCHERTDTNDVFMKQQQLLSIAQPQKERSAYTGSDDTKSDNVIIDLNNTQIVPNRQCRVSFSSKDSRTCLLSHNDSY